MTNYEIADVFTLLSKLSDIHGENSFKVKGYGSAAFSIEKTLKPFMEMGKTEIYSTKGIGASTGAKIEEIIATGQLAALTELINATPEGILEMMRIKGLGPKKIITIWKELEIESVGELLYACNENRLLLYKGFGAKNQQSIKESIEFYLANQGNYLYQQLETAMPHIESVLSAHFSGFKYQIVGEYAMHADVVTKLTVLINCSFDDLKKALLLPNEFIIKTENAEQNIITAHLKAAALLFEFKSVTQLFVATCIIESSSNDFKQSLSNTAIETDTEADFFSQNDLPFIPAFLRNSAAILTNINKLNNIITENDIKGIIHNHSDWSDGTNTIEEMVQACIAMGKEYLVISDHSKSAFYANGLSEERIAQQHKLIETLNNKYAPFRIFKSIECDILNDGSLDYDDDTLATFDLVIASVHSNLKMPEEKAMARLIAAIENPYTTILGHPTGRLLASRQGYPINHKTIIDACAANDVVIELNAHPRRLDIDWSEINYAIEKDVLISIDPDAHNTDGFYDIKYGVIAAQKALVLPQNNLSSFSLSEFDAFLFETRQRKGI